MNGGAIGHSGSDRWRRGLRHQEPALSQLRNRLISALHTRKPHGAIGHSEVTDGSEETAPTQEATPPGHEAAGFRQIIQRLTIPIGHSAVTAMGHDDGQEYLPRRARVEALGQGGTGAYYDRSPSTGEGHTQRAIHHFSRNSLKTNRRLLRQVSVLRAGQEPSPCQEPAMQAHKQTGTYRPLREEPLTESGRREVEYCPDCGSPYTTFNGEERCPDCIDHRRQGE